MPGRRHPLPPRRRDITAEDRSLKDITAVERGTAAVQGRGHQVELQSLRGLAALLVMLHHSSFYYDYGPGPKRVAEFLLNAHAAVVLFFVLSGYVLCLTLVRRNVTLAETARFYVRRACRIYPALWVAVAVALGYVLLFHARPLPDTVTRWWWLPSQRAFPVQRRDYLLALAGITTSATTLPVPIWTLTIELIASVLMPLVAVLALRGRAVLVGLTVVASAFVALSPVAVSPTLAYLPAFLLGASVLVLLPGLERTVRSDTAWRVIAVAGLIALLFGRNAFVADFRLHYTAPGPLIMEAFGGAMLIAAVSARSNALPLLRRPAIVRFGDISYSFYLLHFPVMALVAGIGGEMLRLPPLRDGGVVASCALAAVVFVVTVPLAMVSYRFVELPGIRMAKAMARRITAR